MNTASCEVAFVEYNQKRIDLRIEIRKAQKRSWRELCDSVDNDPWGVPYRLITKLLGRRPPVMDALAVSSIARCGLTAFKEWKSPMNALLYSF